MKWKIYLFDSDFKYIYHLINSMKKFGKNRMNNLTIDIKHSNQRMKVQTNRQNIRKL